MNYASNSISQYVKHVKCHVLWFLTQSNSDSNAHFERVKNATLSLKKLYDEALYKAKRSIFRLIF